MGSRYDAKESTNGEVPWAADQITAHGRIGRQPGFRIECGVQFPTSHERVHCLGANAPSHRLAPECAKLRFLERTPYSPLAGRRAARPLGIYVLAAVAGTVTAALVFLAASLPSIPDVDGARVMFVVPILLYGTACVGLAFPKSWGRQMAAAAAFAPCPAFAGWFVAELATGGRLNGSLEALSWSVPIALSVVLYLYLGRNAREYYEALASPAPRPLPRRRLAGARQLWMTLVLVVPFYFALRTSPRWWLSTFGHLFFDRSDEPVVQTGWLGQPLGTPTENLTIHLSDMKEMLSEYLILAALAAVALWALRHGLRDRRKARPYFVALVMGSALVFTRLGAMAFSFYATYQIKTDSAALQ